MRLIRFFLMLALFLCFSAVLILGCTQVEPKKIKNIIAINKNEVEKIEFYKKNKYKIITEPNDISKIVELLNRIEGRPIDYKHKESEYSIRIVKLNKYKYSFNFMKNQVNVFNRQNDKQYTNESYDLEQEFNLNNTYDHLNYQEYTVFKK